jgi:iron(III) transport system substrate-binding protein
MHSVSSKYPTPPYDAIPTQEILKNTIPVDWQSTLSLRNELRTRFEEAVAKK